MLKAENLNQALADISVIIPAYNRAGLIGETLHSLLNQTVSAKEIIVVDDGSTDGTAEAVLRYAAENGCLMAEDGGAAAAQPMAESEFRRTNSQNPNRHSLNNPLSAIRNPPSITAKPRLRVIRQANAGPGAARNRGLAEATGEFIHFFDSDDIAAPNKHEVQLRALLETGADIAYGPWGKGRFLPLEKLKHGKAETLKTELTTIERQGGRENRKLGKAVGRATESWPQRGAASGSMQVNEQPKVGPKGEGVGTTESNGPNKHGFGNHQRHELTRKEEAGQRLARQAGAAFSNPSTSELARDSENTSLTRFASAPALARIALGGMGSGGGNQLADSGKFLEGQSQAGLQMDSQKLHSPRAAMGSDTSGDNSSSVLISVISGEKNSGAPEAQALDARRARLWSAEHIPAGSTLDSAPLNFVPEGPVLQARGLPEGDLIKALLTNWSIVPHACLFRRSILEKAGGFPEDIWVGEDQVLFLRCLLAGAKVVHTPGTMVYYRVGDDPGKLTATGAAQKRHARDWGRFLLKADKEVTSGEWRVTSAGKRVPAEAQRRGDFLTTIERQGGRENEQPKVGPKGEGVGTTESNGSDIHGYQKTQQGDAQGTCAGAAFSNPFTSELARDSANTSPSRSASGPAEALSADNAGIGSAGGNQLADSKGVLEGQSQAGLQMDFQKLQSIRMANDTSASKGNSSSVPIREIRGFHSVVLDPGLSTLGATSYSLPPACGVRRLLHQAATAPEAPTPATSYSLPATAPEALTSPSAWFGFRLRAYEGWRDLEKFFPDGEGELKENLKRIFLEKRKFPKTEMLKYQAAGFLLRKWGGLRGRIFGHRVKGCFRATFMTQAELNALMISEEKMQ